MTEARHESKTKLLEAALHVIRAKGYTATRVEDLCAAAGVTKGSFFHHFKSKEDLALQAAAYWRERTSGLFLASEYHQKPTARERLLAYVELRKALLQGELPEFTCFAGTMVQEVYQTEPAILEACAGCIEGHAQTLAADIAEAMRDCGMEADWTPASLALHTQAVIQGAFILAKAQGSAQIAVESLNHLRRYLELLFVPQSHTAIAA
jgi:TetR/AcrR family transcriptional repressor of nem operon